MIKFKLCIFGKNATEMMLCVLSASYWKSHDMSHYCDVNFDNLVKVLFAKFFHCKVIMIPFVISKYLVRRYFETTYISCFVFLIKLLPGNFNIHYCLK